jgi:CheY-like chemotaxis protein
LPAHTDEDALVASAAPAAGHPARRALVVDDEAPIRKLLARLLERRGFDVLEADSASVALDIADTTVLSLVLCDVRMPGSNGMDLYRTLSKRHPEIGKAFVFITGDRSSIDIDDALRNVPVLAKPFSADDLHSVLTAVGLDEVVA